jgi:hypothetical protein
MKLKYLYLLLLFNLNLSIYAQRKANISEPYSFIEWKKSGVNDSNSFIIYNNGNNQLLQNQFSFNGDEFINYRRSAKLLSSLSISLISRNFNSYSIYFVSKLTSPQHEVPISCFYSCDSIIDITTSHRFSDINVPSYLNFDQFESTVPKLTSLRRNFNSLFSCDTLSFILNKRPDTPSLPINTDGVLLSELILYNHFLSFREHNRISSYLAIKHGITLSEMDYVNSADDVVWPKFKNKPYTHNVAGITYDRLSELYQNRSSSSSDSLFLSIGFLDSLTTQIRDKNYLIWGDNGKSKAWQDEPMAMLPLSLRTWKIQANTVDLPYTSVHLDAEQAGSLPEAPEAIWLLIDRSGKSDFSMNSTEFYSSTLTQTPMVFNADSIQWDIDRSGNDVFCFGAGPSLLIKHWQRNSTCNGMANGAIFVGVEGGAAPFSISIFNENNYLLKTWNVSDNSIDSLSQLSSGKYTIVVIDAKQRTQTKDLWLQPVDFNAPFIESSYTITDNQLVVVRPEPLYENMNYFWTYNGQKVSEESSFVPQQPGIYELHCVSGTCEYRKPFAVRYTKPNDQLSIQVMPNPSQRGEIVNIRIFSSDDSTPLTLRLNSETGALLNEWNLSDSNQYCIPIKLSDAGIYFVSVSNNQTAKSARFIIK